jgi:hypothetical protein
MSGEPGAGYWNVCRRAPNPNRSWIVRGFAIAVTAVTAAYQCAETQSTARGGGTSLAKARHERV